MRLRCLLVIAATVLSSANPFALASVSDQNSLQKTTPTGGNGEARSLRSLKMTGPENAKEDEERGVFVGLFNYVDDLINPKSAQELQTRAAKQANEEFTNKLISDIATQKKEFPRMKNELVDPESFRHFMKLQDRSEKEITYMVAQYQHFLGNGKVPDNNIK